MESLEDYRVEIDRIDRELTILFEKRMDMVLKVANYKKENNVQIFHKNREDIVFENAKSNLINKDYGDEVVKFFNATMEIGKALQRRKIDDIKKLAEVKVERSAIDKSRRIGFPGVSGSFTEEAATKFFGDKIEKSYYEDFEDIFKALEKDEIYYGIIPIENSSTGAISQNYDLLKKYGFYIVGEEYLKIQQHLVGLKDTNLDKIKEVYSHPQGIEQSSEFLKKYENWKLIPFHNTSTSAKLIKDLSDNTKVAIASSRAASIYGLEIIEECINNQKDNNTRFIVISKELKVVKDADKVSVVFSLENEAGTLYRLLRYFAENNINMIKIESRPTKDTPWKYFLYVDFEGDIDSEEVLNALKLIEKNSGYFKLLGAYKKKI
ncbi:prephenate dehydratase [Clostridium vincentii]|uniref:Bifunctional chorismate mutase/prephenate dehydratase n=1 Tax=Clostridium vincentii TaxID=52704 RepID=A0A2T0BGG8_9CLOT|nr:prephenate dehydratase [Clostridium vincentii]PRR83011.1 P-protein [Clostridium vincentii]